MKTAEVNRLAKLTSFSLCAEESTGLGFQKLWLTLYIYIFKLRHILSMNPVLLRKKGFRGKTSFSNPD